jgi:hypothetical protein
LIGQEADSSHHRLARDPEVESEPSLGHARVVELKEGVRESSFLLVAVVPEGGCGEIDFTQTAKVAPDFPAIGSSIKEAISDDASCFRIRGCVGNAFWRGAADFHASLCE